MSSSPTEPEDSHEDRGLDLVAPEKGDPPESPWRLIAHNKRVLNGWTKLARAKPANAINCYDWLRRDPMRRRPGRCYPLKGRKYSGCWCYEIGSGDRVYYKPDIESRTVRVYYAGEHPRGAPLPPDWGGS